MKRNGLFIATIVGLLSIILGCSSGTSPDTVENRFLTSEYAGSYWGTLTYHSSTIDLCFVVEDDSVALYHSGTSNIYTNIEFTENGDGVVTVTAWANDDTGRANGEKVVGLFSVDGSEYSCVVTIIPMGSAQTGTLVRGAAYAGEYDPVVESDLYGAYWGTLVFAGTHEMCLDIRENTITFHSNIMGIEYTNIAYTQGTDGIWRFATYADNDPTQSGAARCTGVFTISGDGTATCVATIVPMSATTDTLTRGNGYNNEYTY